MELNVIFSWIEIIVLVFFIIVLIFSIYFWFKEKDKERFFISLKDILEQIDSVSVDSVNKEQYKQAIIENAALGTNRRSDDVARALSTISVPVELESKKFLTSPNFPLLIVTMIILVCTYIIEILLDLGYTSYGPSSVVSEILLKLLKKLSGIVLIFLFMAYLFPLIKEFWVIIKKKFKNN